MKIFVTGANGSIGKQITKYLANKGHKITAIVRSIEWQDKNITFIKGDLFDINKFVDNKFDVVIHMAASTRMYDRSNTLYKNNYLLTKKLIAYFKKSYFVYFSSIEAFGPTTEKLVTVKDTAMPITDYGKIKLKTEKLIERSKLKYVILRIGNVESKTQGIVKSIKSYSKLQQFLLKNILFDYELNIIKIEEVCKILDKILILKPKNKIIFAVQKRIKIKELFENKDGNFEILLPVVVGINMIMSKLKFSSLISYIVSGGIKRKYRNYEAKY